LAAIVGLEALTKPCAVSLTTDSQYVKQGIESWMQGWKKRNWQTSNKTAVKNIDLWQRLDQVNSQHDVSWHWVKGHTGHAQNERCDDLARDAAQSKQLLEDLGYIPN